MFFYGTREIKTPLNHLLYCLQWSVMLTGERQTLRQLDHDSTTIGYITIIIIMLPDAQQSGIKCTAIRGGARRRQKIINSQQSNQSALRKKIGRRKGNKVEGIFFPFFCCFFSKKTKKEKKHKIKSSPRMQPEDDIILASSIKLMRLWKKPGQGPMPCPGKNHC